MIITLLHVSNKHLDEEAREAFEKMSLSDMMYLDEMDDYSDLPEDLFNVIAFAQSLGVRNIIINENGTELSNLPVTGV